MDILAEYNKVKNLDVIKYDNLWTSMVKEPKQTLEDYVKIEPNHVMNVILQIDEKCNVQAENI